MHRIPAAGRICLGRPLVRTRFKRPKRRKIGPWPSGARAPEEVAEDSVYRGSNEHKNHPSPVGPPALRSDATPCDPLMTQDMDRNTLALREGIRRRCTSAVFENGFPKYVWTWVGADLYEARHINGPHGSYKGYRLDDPVEWPEDPDGCLRWGNA